MNRTIVMIDWAKPVTRDPPNEVGREGRANRGVELDEVVDVGRRLGVRPNRSTAASSSAGMPVKPSVPSRKRPTATSSAAISAADARGPEPAGLAGDAQRREARLRRGRGSRAAPAATRSAAAAGDGRRSG